MTLDMTTGKPLRLMIRFAIPVLLSSILQLMYSMCDSVIVGQLLGANAFAAVSSCANINWFTLSMFMGLSQGFGVILAQRFGAKDETGFRQALTGSLVLIGLFALVLTGICLASLDPFIRLLKTPVELIGNTSQYMRVLWSGLALTALYNILDTALRAMGDTRTPLIALAISSIMNIALDYVFIAYCHWGVAGAALATVLSQAVAAAFCLIKLMGLRFAKPRKADWRPRAITYKALLRLGIPLLLRLSVTSTGELAVQTAINACGLIFVTGMAASRRYFSLLNITGNALEAALITYVSQNAGARQPRRILDGTRSAVKLGLGSSAVIMATVITLAKPLILLFLPHGDAQAIQIGIVSLRIETSALFILSPLLLYRAAIQGVGRPMIPMLSGFLELGLRLIVAFALPKLFGQTGLYFTDAITWLLTAIMLTLYYLFAVRRSLLAQCGDPETQIK